MWNLPGSEIESGSPALASGFFTTELPGKPIYVLGKRKILVLTFGLVMVE